ncbi:MAG: hypothetical protein WAK17_23130, partial [Candidatus Nitrosopolaris sp.]
MTIAIVTIHDACPAFSAKIFKFTGELERLNIKYNRSYLVNVSANYKNTFKHLFPYTSLSSD